MLFVASEGRSRLIDLETKAVHRTYATTCVGKRGLTYCASSRSVIVHQPRGCTSFFSSATQQAVQRSFCSETIMCSTCTSDGVFLVGGTADGNIYVWATLTGQLHRLVRAHTRCVTDIAISSDQSLLVTASEDSVCKTWSLASLVARGTKSPAPRALFNGHTLAVNACSFMESGYLVATGSADCTCRIFDALTGRQHLVITVDDALTSVRFSPGDDLLLLGSANGSLFFVSLYATPSQPGLPTSLRRRDDVVVRKSFEDGHSGAVVFILFDVSRPDHAIVGSADGAVLWWCASTRTARGEAFPRLPGGLCGGCLLPRDRPAAPPSWPAAAPARHPLDPAARDYAVVLAGPAANCGGAVKKEEEKEEEEKEEEEKEEEGVGAAGVGSGRKRRLEAIEAQRQKNSELEGLRDRLRQKLQKLTAA